MSRLAGRLLQRGEGGWGGALGADSGGLLSNVQYCDWQRSSGLRVLRQVVHFFDALVENTADTFPAHQLLERQHEHHGVAGAGEAEAVGDGRWDGRPPQQQTGC